MTDYPPMPTEAPLILKAPEDAFEKAVAAAMALQARAYEITEATVSSDWAKVSNLLSMLGALEKILEGARQVVSHGDLNVDEIVMQALSDGDWHDTWLSGSKSINDWRLGIKTYQHPKYSWNQMSPIDAVIYRLEAEGKVKKHGGRNAIRLKKPGEK